MLRRINDALPGLVAGILIYGVLLEATLVWFVDDPAAYSIGLWYGIAIAIGMAVNMAIVIFDSTFEDTDGGTNYRVVAKSILRYVVVVVLFAILAFFRFGYVIAAFLGVMGLKVSAYMQPLIQKFEIKIGLREPDPELLMEAAEFSVTQSSRRDHYNRNVRSSRNRRNRSVRSNRNRRNRSVRSNRNHRNRRNYRNRRICGRKNCYRKRCS